MRFIDEFPFGTFLPSTRSGIALLNTGPLEHVPLASRAHGFCAPPFALRVLVIVILVALSHEHCAGAQIELPASNLSDRIIVAADNGSHWTEGVYDVYLLHGSCYINQGLTYARCQDALLWIERGGLGGEPPHKVIAYLDGEVEITYQQPAGAEGKGGGTAKLTDKTWFGRFYSVMPVDVRPMPTAPEPATKPDIYRRALAARDPASATVVQKTQFAEAIAPPPAVVVPPLGMTRIRLQRRSAVDLQVESLSVPNTNELITIVKSGVNVVVDGLDEFGSIDVDTDNLVVWTEAALTSGGEAVQSKDKPLEIYMEGNIVFRQGERTIYAQRMYYDVRRQTGIVLMAEVLTPVPQHQGLLKLRAEVLQQMGPDRFVAKNGSLTSSRFGIPGYELRSNTMTFTDLQHPRIDPVTGTPEVDPTGAPVIDHEKMATGRNNFFYIEQVPVFYWPFMATNLEQSNFYVNSIAVTQDQIFGTRIMSSLDAYQLFGIKNKPPGTRWSLTADYFTMRGPAAGTNFNYTRQTLFGVPQSTTGFVDGWFIVDHGLDNLGLERRDFVPLTTDRGRVLAQHRQQLPNNFQLTGEFGWISDYNFLEQYYEREWDQLKDQTTDLELKQYVDNSSWSIFGSARLENFFTDTQWLPRVDHFWLGEPLLNDRLTWYEHSSLGYGQFQTAVKPSNPIDAINWAPLPWEVPSSGGREVTRQELDAPFAAGVVKLDPYGLGELAHWGQVLNGNDLSRAYGVLGIRASMPLWAVDPTIKSSLFNVNGIAHKMVFETDVSYAQTTTNLQNLPLYDPLDDNNIEAYRRWFQFTDFGGPPIPPQFDSRFYALRYGLQNWVSSPSTEIAGDLFAARLGLKQRWQTKRGPVGNQRIVDWITFNTGVTIFPNASRDNFGETFGLANFDFRWHIGDRTTIVSDGYADFFAEAPKYFTLGAFINRTTRGSFYLGFRGLQGPINSNVVITSYTYRMSPKWMSTFGMSFDVAEARNIGQNITITRIGESFLTMVNVNVDTSKGNVGATIAIQPRFMQGQMGPSNGMPLPVAGVFGLE